MTSRAHHFALAGHHVAMAEFLRRGWNVAATPGDPGDDMFIVHDGDTTFRRVHIKVRRAARDPDSPRWLPVRFPLSREQLLHPNNKKSALYYMFMAFQDEHWHYLLLSQSALAKLRRSYEARPGAKPVDPKSDDLAPNVLFNAGAASLWGVMLPANAWHPDFAEHADTPTPHPRPRSSPRKQEP